MNRFSHVDLRVTDIDAALQFYALLMPVLGFTREFHGEEWKVFTSEDALPRTAYFAFTEDPGHRPNANRIAFWAESREAVDRAAAVLREAGATITGGPRNYQEYSASYYAVYFMDPSRNCLEIVHRTD